MVDKPASCYIIDIKNYMITIKKAVIPTNFPTTHQGALLYKKHVIDVTYFRKCITTFQL
jgi:hypothetical protein